MASLILRSARNTVLRNCINKSTPSSGILSTTPNSVNSYTNVRFFSEAQTIPGVGKGKTSTGLVSRVSVFVWVGLNESINR